MNGSKLCFWVILFDACVIYTVQFTKFAALKDRRCDAAGSLIASANKANVLQCAGFCLETSEVTLYVACDSFNFNANATTDSCELLQTSETDFNTLTQETGWIFYTFNPLLTRGKYRYTTKK